MSIAFLNELILIIAAAFIGGYTARTLKLPVVLGYIGAGIVFGIIGRNYFPSYTTLVAFSNLGISLLLFTLGFEISFEKLKRLDKKVFIASVLQLAVTAVVCFPLVMLLNLEFPAAILLSALFSFSSTAAVVKILEEKGTLAESPSPQIFLFLLLQDIYVVPIILLLPFLGSFHPLAIQDVLLLVLTLLKPALAIGLLLLVGKYFLSSVLRVLYQYPSHELTILATIFLATLAVGILKSVGVPDAVAAFIAGVIISEQGENIAPLSEIRPIRDVLLVLFFVVTGMLLDLSFVISHLPIILAVTCAVLFLKFVVFDIILLSLRYSHTHAVIIASYTANIGELVVVVAQMAFLSHILSNGNYNIVLSVFILSLFFIPFFLSFSEVFRERIVHLPLFKSVFRLREDDADSDRDEIRDHVVVLGHGKVGEGIVTLLSMAHIPYIVVDFDKKSVDTLTSKRIRALFGDPGDEEVLTSSNIHRAKVLILADVDENVKKKIITYVKRKNPSIRILCRSGSEDEHIDELLDLGVALISIPEFEAGLTLGQEVLDTFHIRRSYIQSYVEKFKKRHHII